MEWSKLAELRHRKHWTLAQAAEEMSISINTLSRWERGSQSPHGYNLRRLCDTYGISETELSDIQDNTEDMNRRQTLQFLGMSGISLFAGNTQGSHLWADDLLTSYSQGVAACQELHFSGKSSEVERILPLYRSQTSALARYPSPVQAASARLASQSCRIACSLATDHEDFRIAQQAGQEALEFAQLAEDVNLQVAALISLANIGFHRKLSLAALQSYKQAVSLLNDHVTPLLKGRVFAGIAEVYAMRQDRQESMRALGHAYEWYPVRCEDDPSYAYLHTSRYSLYMFGDVQSRLFLGQPKEASKALAAMLKETKEPQLKPMSKLDMLYYQADIAIQQKELEASTGFLAEAATFAKNLRSRLYFNKLSVSYQTLQSQYPKEPSVIALEEVLQPW